VVGFDNLSSGSRANLRTALENPRFRLIEGDLSDFEALRTALGDFDMVFHLAADPEVITGSVNPQFHIQQNFLATFNIAEALRARKNPTRLIFASSSTIYGEPSIIPTPEDYGPLLPISTYGSTKLASEALLASYAHLFPLQVIILRFANVVGGRSRHGVIYDFFRKLLEDKKELEILGDGTQTKSYMHVDDCVEAFLKALDEDLWEQLVNVYNIGTEDRINVFRIAQIVIDTLGLGDVTVRTVEGPGGRGWIGDVKVMQLDISKMKRHSWQPKFNSDQAIQLSARELLNEFHAKV